jgi:hypothetical protein
MCLVVSEQSDVAKQTHLYTHLSGANITSDCYLCVSVKCILPQNCVMQPDQPISALVSLGPYHILLQSVTATPCDTKSKEERTR